MSALQVDDLTYSYDSRSQTPVLDGLNLSVAPGEVFGLLGPNGSGKTTLFRLLTTLAKIQGGSIEVFGRSVARERAAVRKLLGIVFQSPSLDPKLTVLENIRCQAALYGLTGAAAKQRIEEVTEQLSLQDRLKSKTEELSGGLKRRVELAKGILHRPSLLLMDEPSTGLDPSSRLDLWHALQLLRENNGVTILLTTHLLEEADKADRIAILDQGKTVAIGKPVELRSSLGGNLLCIQTSALEEVRQWLTDRGEEVHTVDQQLRVSSLAAAKLVAPLSAEFGEQLQSLTLGQPSLEDVFIARTGHRFWDERKVTT